MTTRYLLPCKCGENLQVDASEAGLTLTCVCGAQLEAPTLRGLTKLQKVVVLDPPAKEVWGGRQRGIVIGTLVALLGFSLGLYWTMKPSVTPREALDIRELSHDASPAETLVLWQQIQIQGLFRASETVAEKKYRRPRRLAWWWMIAGYLTGVAGLAVIGLSYLIASASRQGQPQTPKTERRRSSQPAD